MDRSLFPEGVEVHSDDLTRSELVKSFHILQRHIDVSSRGVVEGLEVTINAVVNTNINIATGLGYTPNGELAELLAASTNVPLVDYTLNVKNYVLLMYRENAILPKPHETNGESFPTSAVRASSVVVLTETQYNALPSTDENLNNNARDRALLLAIVVAQGVAISLTSSNITLPSLFNGGVTAVNTTLLITGVSLLRIDPTTLSGFGTLTYTFAGTTITWQAPGDITPGAAVNISSGGVFVLFSTSGVSLTILVFSSLLPLANKVDSISVTNIYTQTVARQTALDIQHRSLIGSGVPSVKNPHGMTPQDLGLSENIVEQHQDLFHSNGIHRDSSVGFLNCVVNTGVLPHEITVGTPVAGDSLYLNGFRHTALVSSSVTFLITDPLTNTDHQKLFDIYAVEGLNAVASLEKVERARYDTAPPPPLALPVQLRDVSENTPAGAAQIFFDFAAKRLQYKAPTDGAFGAAVRIPNTGVGQDATVRLHSQTGQYFLDVYVAEQASARWAAILVNATENLTIAALPVALELDRRLKLCTVVFSGSATGFLGNGHTPVVGPNNPNFLIDRRLYGFIGGSIFSSMLGATGPTDLRNDLAHWDVLLSPLGVPLTTQQNISYMRGNVGIGTRQLEVIGALGQTFGSRLTILRTLSNFGLRIVGDGTNSADMLLDMPANPSNQRTIQAQIDSASRFILRSLNDDHGVLNEFLRYDLINNTMSLGPFASAAPTTIGLYSRRDWITPIVGEAYGTFLDTRFDQAGQADLKQGLRLSTRATHAAGAFTGNLIGVLSLVLHGGGVGTSTTQMTGFWTRQDSAAGSAIGTMTGIALISPVIGGTATTVVGLDVGNMVGGSVNNYAIRTGLGRVNLGDDTDVLGNLDVYENFRLVTPLGFVNSNFHPIASNTWNLGETGKRWNSIWAQQGFFTENIQVPTTQEQLVMRHAQNCIVARVFLLGAGGAVPTIVGNHWNVLSVARNGVGDYTITFDQALDDNCSSHLQLSSDFDLAIGRIHIIADRIRAVGTVLRFITLNAAHAAQDLAVSDRVFITVIGRPRTLP